MHPLPDTHPELSVSFAASGVVELRVENWNLRKFKDGQKRKPPESPRNLIITVCVAYVLFKVRYTSLNNSILIIKSSVRVSSIFYISIHLELRRLPVSVFEMYPSTPW